MVVHQMKVDLIGPLSKGKENAYHTIVVIDYFTKEVMAEPLTKITEVDASKFIWKISSVGPHLLVSDNVRQFASKKVKDLCEELKIKKHFFSITPSKWPSRGGQQNHQAYLDKEA